MASIPRTFRALVLLTDAFGGKGGIAKFNRDLLSAICEMPNCAEVIALPRLAPDPLGVLPKQLTFELRSLGGKFAYLRAALSTAVRTRFDVVLSAHINLCPLGLAIARTQGVPCGMIIHGIEAWSPHRSHIVRMAVPHIDYVIGVSELTLERFRRWSGVDPRRCLWLPNCVDFARYSSGARPVTLSRELGIEGKTVLMTLGRLDSFERQKGFDEVLDALPKLMRDIPDIVYLICGDGNDRKRLERKADELSIRGRVVFTGFVAEERKAEFYRLADAFVMPSQGEGFGIVLLEAMACGVPTLGSVLDGSREALRNGMLGVLVDPRDPAGVEQGILATLRRAKGAPAGLDYYSNQNFRKRAQEHMMALLTGRSTRPRSLGRECR